MIIHNFHYTTFDCDFFHITSKNNISHENWRTIIHCVTSHYFSIIRKVLEIRPARASRYAGNVVSTNPPPPSTAWQQLRKSGTTATARLATQLCAARLHRHLLAHTFWDWNHYLK